MADFSKLPIELINIIINYTDVVIYRDGKYINRIKQDDERYNIIDKRRIKPIKVGNLKQLFKFTFHNGIEKRYLIFEQIYNPNSNKHYLINKSIVKTYDNLSTTVEYSQYVYDSNGFLIREK